MLSLSKHWAGFFSSLLGTMWSSRSLSSSRQQISTSVARTGPWTVRTFSRPP